MLTESLTPIVSHADSHSVAQTCQSGVTVCHCSFDCENSWCVTCALLSIGYVQLTVHVMTVKAPVELCVTIKIVTYKLLEFVSY